MPKGTDRSNHTAIYAVQLLTLEKVFMQKCLEAINYLIRIETVLANLVPLERLLIRERYILGRSWDDVCRNIHYSNSRVHELHGIILKKLEKVDSIRQTDVL